MIPLKTITKARAYRDIAERHPCFSEKAHKNFGRLHLPVAPACNIQCRYCIRKYDCASESRPGITSRVLTPSEAMERVRALTERNEKLSVIGIAGPGDPLANDATFETMAAIHREFPDLILCLSTNGLLLNDRLSDLVSCGVSSLTVTINAFNADTADRIYSRVSYRGRTFTGLEAAELLLHRQWNGLSNAVEAGFMVKVNTICIPGINEAEIPIIARLAGGKGADIMNIMPLIPQAELAQLERPDRTRLHRHREECKVYVPQMTHCKQCRADACGTLGEDGDMELELLHARIGEEYSETVF